MSLALVTANSYGSLVYLLAAVFAGGLVQVIYQAVRNRRRDPVEDSEIARKAVKDELGGLKDLLAEYRIEVEVNKRQLEDYRNQLNQITLDLSRAQVRIGLLEDQLRDAKSESTAVQRELEGTKRRRDELQVERDRLSRETAELRERIKGLEDATGITERLAEARAGHEPPLE